MSKRTTKRSTKEERRREIVEAAMHEFGIGGLHGTPVEAIAERAGVSLPYVFKLFGTKRALFLEAVSSTFQRTVAVLRKTAAEARPNASADEILVKMGVAYAKLLDDDREVLLMHLQAHAAAEDGEVRKAVWEELAGLVNLVRSTSGASDEAIIPWLAVGMLTKAAAALSSTSSTRTGPSVQWPLASRAPCRLQSGS